MPYIDFTNKDYYYNPLGSVKLKGEGEPNNISVPDCDVALNNQKLDINDCKIKWNPDPESTYKMQILYGDSKIVNLQPDWSSMPPIHQNRVISNPNAGVVLDNANNTAEVIYPGMAVDGDYCYSNFSTELELPPVFLDFEGDFDNNCNNINSVQFNFTWNNVIGNYEYEYEMGNKQPANTTLGNVPDGYITSYTYPDLTGETYTNFNTTNYLRIREACLFKISNSWSNGTMSSSLSVIYQSQLLETQAVGFISGPGIDGVIYYYNPSQIVNFDQNIRMFYIKNYRSVTRNSFFYQNLPNYLKEELPVLNSTPNICDNIDRFFRSDNSSTCVADNFLNIDPVTGIWNK